MSKRRRGNRGMNKDVLKSRDKVLTKMTKDGVVEQNLTTGDETRISKRDAGFDLRNKTPDHVITEIFGEDGVTDNTFTATTQAVKADDTPIKSSKQADHSSSSQVGTRLNRRDITNSDSMSSKQKSARIRRKQELSKSSVNEDNNKDRAEIVQIPSAQLQKGSENNVLPFAPRKPPLESQVAVSASSVQTENANADNPKTLPFTHDNGINRTDNATSTTSTTNTINTTRNTKLNTAPADGYEPKSRITHKRKTPSTLSKHGLSNIRRTPKTREFAVEPPSDKSEGRMDSVIDVTQTQVQTNKLTSPADGNKPQSKITHKRKRPTTLSEHRLSNTHQTPKTRKFAVAPPPDIAEGRTDSGIDTTQAQSKKHSLRPKSKRDAQSVGDTANPSNSSKLKFAEDERETPQSTTIGDNKADEVLQNISDQEVPPQEDIPQHQPRSPTSAGGSTAISSTSSRSQQIRHKRKNPSPITAPKVPNAGTDGLDVKPKVTPSPKQSTTKQHTQPQSPKISKLEHRVEKTTAKLDKAKNNLPAKRKIRVERTFDEDKGKISTRLKFDKEVKSQAEHLNGSLPMRPIKFTANAAIAKAHMKIYQVEHENVGTQAAHKVELAGETVVRSALRHHKFAPYKKVARLERKLSQCSAKLAYRRAVELNPRLKKNPIARLWQKRKIKRQHAKALREAQKAATRAKKAGSLTARATKALGMFIKKNPKVIIAVVVLFLVINIFSSLIGMLSSVGSSGAGAIFATTYLSEELEIEAVSLTYNRWEMDLMMEILNVEQNHPGFDEYRFNAGDISHNPFELIAYLTATRFIFTLYDVETELQALFNEQYQLSFTSSVEVRFRDSGAVDPEDNPIYEPYNWHVLTVTLVARNFTDVIFNRMTPDQRIHFDLLMQSRGQRQIVGNPFDFPWRSFITSEYGYRIHPITGVRDLHRGIDIGVPTGTEILAGFDGIVTFASYNGGYGNVVIIQGNNGLEARYAHMDTIDVTVGQDVDMGDVIGTVGSTGSSTGPHLHMEVLRNGQFLNPIFFVSTGDSILSPSYGVPNAPMGDETFQRLWVEIYRALGRPYVWGASGPNAFDCSGFIFHVFNQSGVLSIPRTTAQGYYNMSTRIPRSELRPGDLVFFQGTFSTYRTVTHVGVYVGNGNMAHAGTPVQIASFETPFWSRHFYGFGRLH